MDSNDSFYVQIQLFDTIQKLTGQIAGSYVSSLPGADMVRLNQKFLLWKIHYLVIVGVRSWIGIDFNLSACIGQDSTPRDPFDDDRFVTLLQTIRPDSVRRSGHAFVVSHADCRREDRRPLCHVGSHASGVVIVEMGWNYIADRLCWEALFDRREDLLRALFVKRRLNDHKIVLHLDDDTVV